jgi:structural maintenance of chromosome 1
MKESETRNRQRIEDEKKDLHEVEKQVVKFKEDSAKLNDELNDIVQKISEAHGESNETRREQNRREALENLKRVFPDKVYGRLVDLCAPSHKKFNIAITKVSLLIRSLPKRFPDSPKAHDFHRLRHG